MRRCLPFMAAYAALLCASPAQAQPCRDARRAATDHDLSTMRSAVVCLVNQQRTARGLPPLHEDSRLDRSAQGWTRKMVARHVFTHGSNFADRISAAGLPWSAAGENIATGYPTPATVVAGWMGSPGHCWNILDPTFSALGVGMVAAPVRGYASGPATWTQDFALPQGHRPPSHNERPQRACPY